MTKPDPRKEPAEGLSFLVHAGGVVRLYRR